MGGNSRRKTFYFYLRNLILNNKPSFPLPPDFGRFFGTWQRRAITNKNDNSCRWPPSISLPFNSSDLFLSPFLLFPSFLGFFYLIFEDTTRYNPKRPGFTNLVTFLKRATFN